jgi:hypothetical protein
LKINKNFSLFSSSKNDRFYLNLSTKNSWATHSSLKNSSSNSN